jgi:ATP-dependent Clp protease protease subunit
MKEKGEKEESKVLDRLLKTRTLLLSGEVTPVSARKIIEQLLVLEAEDEQKPITLIINSPGGDVHSGFAIYDCIRFIKPEVRIVCAGLTASIATVILLAAKKVCRMSLPNARFLLHQPMFQTEVFGPASDLEITANEILKTKDKINRLISLETGQPIERVEKDTQRDFWLSAEEAKSYGLIYEIVTGREEIPTK